MDIFTTALTRVVPVPIKPANLKVKALLKEAGAGKLKEDPDHLENHDYYFTPAKKEKDKEQQSNQQQAQQQSLSQDVVIITKENIDMSVDDNAEQAQEIDEKPIKHLDVYI